jgi:MOSC domain-containing protein YiiM
MERSADELRAGLDSVREAPTDDGVVELIVRRPAVGQRELLEECELDPASGLVGDSWSTRGTRPNPAMQLTLMNARATALVAGDRGRWPLAGDQLYVDLALGEASLPPGTRLAVGTAIVEVTDVPHRGCGKFTQRFGVAARDFVNSDEGVELNLRGINARVVQAGVVRRGDRVRKVATAPPT